MKKAAKATTLTMAIALVALGSTACSNTDTASHSRDQTTRSVPRTTAVTGGSFGGGDLSARDYTGPR